MLLTYGVSDKGRIRSRNEDCFVSDDDLQFCAVADGMGGHNAGDIAARIAIDTMIEYIRGDARGMNETWPFGIDGSLSHAGNRMRTAIHLANRRVLDASVGSKDYLGMGTTVVAVLLVDGWMTIGHVGDSRVYLVRNGQLSALTEDDSYAAVLARDPSIDPVVARTHPMRNALTNVVGHTAKTQVHVLEQPLADDDLLLLTTDGVHGILEDSRMERLMGQSGDVRDLAGTIVAAALARGSRDNCTAVVARYLAD